MSVNVFGLTAAILRADYLPNADDFSASSSPTSATVSRLLNQKAAELQGKLLKKSIVASSITDSASAEYLWCQETLGLMVMIRVCQLMTGLDPELAKSWQARLSDRFESLEEDGPAALGNASLSTTAGDPNGPTTHITELGLDTTELSSTYASIISFPLRKDDQL